MKTSLLERPSPPDQALNERLERHPALKARLSSILDMVENSGGDLLKAEAAERRALEELRQLGQEVLQGWAERRIEASCEALRSEGLGVVGDGKKIELAHDAGRGGGQRAVVSAHGAAREAVSRARGD